MQKTDFNLQSNPFMHLLSLTGWWIHSWNIDFILCFNNPLLKRIMQSSLKFHVGCVTAFSNCINHLWRSIILLYSLFLSSPLSLPSTKTSGMAFRHPWRSLKHVIGKRDVWNTRWIGLCDLTVEWWNWETCWIHHTVKFKFRFEFALFTSRADYWNEWNQYSMNKLEGCVEEPR